LSEQEDEIGIAEGCAFFEFIRLTAGKVACNMFKLCVTSKVFLLADLHVGLLANVDICLLKFSTTYEHRVLWYGLTEILGLSQQNTP